MNLHCLVIAEAGVNHNGKLENALKLIDTAKDAGADIVKFQTFNAELLASESAEKAEYQKKQTGIGSQFEMLKKLELSKEDYINIFKYAKSKNIKCISTPFDLVSLDFLLSLGMDTIKIPSGEVTNGPFLLEIGRRNKHIILSTGMCDLIDIENALAVLSYGLLRPTETPKSLKEVLSIWHDGYEKNISFLKDKITILHCTTNYPAEFDEINLNAMLTIKERFGLNVGYSDHSLGTLVPTVATSMGACVIEKHITLDKTMEGPDHAASLEFNELKEMIQNIRNVETIKGSIIKAPSNNELENSKIARRGLYANKDIAIGDELGVDNVIALRPLAKKSPMHYWELLCTNAKKPYKKGDAI